MLSKLSKEELYDLLIEYDIYIQDANDDDLYYEGWKPVCIEEFFVNDYPLIKDSDE